MNPPRLRIVRETACLTVEVVRFPRESDPKGSKYSTDSDSSQGRTSEIQEPGTRN
jgi:hypothetical protein